MLAMCTNGPCKPETQLTVTVCRIMQLEAGAKQGHREREEVKEEDRKRGNKYERGGGEKKERNRRSKRKEEKMKRSRRQRGEREKEMEKTMRKEREQGG